MNSKHFACRSIRAIAISTLICGFAFLAGCNEEAIKGEAFIGLKSGETLRLSDMQVWFFDESFIEIQKKHAAEYGPKVSAAYAIKDDFSKMKIELLRLQFAALGLVEGGAISKTRTDSNGHFSIPPNAKLVLAFYERESPTEQMVWAIRVSNPKSISLTGSNITRSSDYDSTLGMSILGTLINVGDLSTGDTGARY